MTSFARREARQKALEAVEAHAKQFRGRGEIRPFRVPHEPVAIDAAELDRRVVLRMEWPDAHWELWSVTLPSGILVYGDTDGHETRVLASARRGRPAEADGFFLERLAESRGEFFGIEMTGPPPQRVRSSLGDRAFLADVFVELFEGTGRWDEPIGVDFRTDVVRWLDRVLAAPPATRRQPRVADAFAE